MFEQRAIHRIGGWRRTRAHLAGNFFEQFQALFIRGIHRPEASDALQLDVQTARVSAVPGTENRPRLMSRIGELGVHLASNFHFGRFPSLFGKNTLKNLPASDMANKPGSQAEFGYHEMRSRQASAQCCRAFIKSLLR